MYFSISARILPAKLQKSFLFPLLTKKRVWIVATRATDLVLLMSSITRQRDKIKIKMCSGTEQEQVLFSLDKTPDKVGWVLKCSVVTEVTATFSRIALSSPKAAQAAHLQNGHRIQFLFLPHSYIKRGSHQHLWQWCLQHVFPLRIVVSALHVGQVLKNNLKRDAK